MIIGTPSRPSSRTSNCAAACALSTAARSPPPAVSPRASTWRCTSSSAISATRLRRRPRPTWSSTAPAGATAAARRHDPRLEVHAQRQEHLPRVAVVGGQHALGAQRWIQSRLSEGHGERREMVADELTGQQVLAEEIIAGGY